MHWHELAVVFNLKDPNDIELHTDLDFMKMSDKDMRAFTTERLGCPPEAAEPYVSGAKQHIYASPNTDTLVRFSSVACEGLVTTQCFAIMDEAATSAILGAHKEIKTLTSAGQCD